MFLTRMIPVKPTHLFRFFILKLILCILLVCGLNISYCFSQVTFFSLSEARQEALAVNLSRKIAKEKITEAEANSEVQFKNFLPQIDASSHVKYINHEQILELDKGSYGTYPILGPFPSDKTSVEIGKNTSCKLALHLKQPIFTGGKLYYNYHSVKADEEIVRWDEKIAVQDILIRLEQAYLNVLKDEETLSLFIKHEETLQAHLKDLTLLYNKGRVAFYELLKIRVEVSRAKVDTLQAENNLKNAKGQLNIILDRSFSDPINVQLVLDPPVMDFSFRDLQNWARINSPVVKKTLAQCKEAKFSRKEAESGYYPKLHAVAEYDLQTENATTESENFQIMLNMDIPLWQWGKTDEQVRSARSIERQKKLALKIIDQQLAADIQEAFNQLHEAQQLVAVEEKTIEVAHENLRMAEIAFAEGRVTSTDVLDAEELLSNTMMLYTKDRYDAYFAYAVLRYHLGMMEEESITPLIEKDGISLDEHNEMKN